MGMGDEKGRLGWGKGGGGAAGEVSLVSALEVVECEINNCLQSILLLARQTGINPECNIVGVE